MSKILVTGGAGFIGSHIIDLLVSKKHEVVILDNLDPQVHPNSQKPDYLNENAKFIKGDIRNPNDIENAIEGCEIVFHEAATVGVGQSMYEIERYTDVTERGTSMLWDFIVNKENDVKKFIVAASMSSYGEGLYESPVHGFVEPPLRTEEQMKSGKWELICDDSGKELKPVPTPETKTQHCNSVYALNKKMQEELSLILGNAYGIPTVALRYFNVYGPRQSLSNPYTGVAAIFMSRVKNNNAPVVYEDGLQSRDFVSVYDIARANLAVMESNKANYQVFNVGTGNAISIKQMAQTIIDLYNSPLKLQVTQKFRKGDIRHCFSDISKIKKALNWAPQISFEQGMRDLIAWSKNVEAEDNFDKVEKELKDKGLV